MKSRVLTAVLLVITGAAAYSGGLSESALVNVQEIDVANITGIEIAYHAEEIILRQSGAGVFVLKEYMQRDNSRYYANINTAGTTLYIERGRRPAGWFNARVEIFIPRSYTNAVTVNTSSGAVVLFGEAACSLLNIKTSSGEIKTEAVSGSAALESNSGRIETGSIQGNVTAKTNSGEILIGNVQGNVTAESNSGGIKTGAVAGGAALASESGEITTGVVDGDITIETSSGSIRAAAGDSTESILLTTSSGGVTLRLPKTFEAAFLSRSKSGSLSTPFPDKLFMQLSDPQTTRGVTGADSSPSGTIKIQTNSGSIRVQWIE